ncbi:hypothetical protein ACH4VS_26495 [Streptomyces hygroscopicus]|uniref:hypothetical protein n=1 Tax=Streptomyces hygroscopicus TaxID=1912 RepID=UPI00082D1346|nr:hypothetical protein [Streptomyces hygroscopicus]
MPGSGAGDASEPSRERCTTSASSSSAGRARVVCPRGLGLPTAPLTPDEAAPHFHSPSPATFYGFDGPVSSAHTQRLLGWSPTHPTLLDDLEHGDYLATPPAS